MLILVYNFLQIVQYETCGLLLLRATSPNITHLNTLTYYTLLAYVKYHIKLSLSHGSVGQVVGTEFFSCGDQQL